MTKNFQPSALMVVILTCLIMLFSLPAVSAQDFFADMFPGLRLIQVEEGQNFTYSIRVEQEGKVTTGEIDFLLVEIDHGLMEVVIKGEFGGQAVSTRAMGWKDNPQEIITNIGSELMASLPGEMEEMFMSTFSMAMMFTAFYGDQFVLGWELKDDEYGDGVVMSIPEMRSYAGVEGYLVRVGEGDEGFMEFGIRPDLLLPLMVNVRGFMDAFDDEIYDDEIYFEDFKYNIELIGFSEDADVSQVEIAETEVPLLILASVVEYFREQGLAVGERSPKFYDMMGAAAGFGVDIEGDEVELYLFDPETATPELLESLEIARETGKFDMMGFPMPAVINGNILMTGLEFGSFYQHPAKDEIIEVFMSYQ